MKTKTEIIDETVAYYSEDPPGRRGVSLYGFCVFLTSDGKMCAVGRCMIAPEVNGVIVDDRERLDNRLKPEYRGHDKEFWRSLQIFHDDFWSWNEEGLTKDGFTNLERLKNEN